MDEWLPVSQFAKLFGVHESTVRFMIYGGNIHDEDISRAKYLAGNRKKITGTVINTRCIKEYLRYWYDVTRVEGIQKKKTGIEYKKSENTVTWTPVKDELGFEMLPEELLRLKQIRDKNGLTSAMGGDDGFTEQVGIGV